jgi:hypothetical protein
MQNSIHGIDGKYYTAYFPVEILPIAGFNTMDGNKL